MLSESAIKDLSVKWQTTKINVVREYLQHLFLSYLYQQKEAEDLAFKGGTALRLLFRSPRFSEDLDFSGLLKPFHLAKLLPKVVSKIEQEGVFLKTQEAKATSGGFLAPFEGEFFAEKVRLEINISLRKRVKPEPILVTTPLHPSYQCLTLPIHELAREKCEALLSRKKPRDYYDLYFLLRGRLGIEVIASLKKKLVESTQGINAKEISRELKVFLPISHHQIVTKLDTLLLGELNRL